MDDYLSKPWLKFYPEGVPENVDIPSRSVPEIFDEMAEKYSNKTALVFYGQKISYRKLKELIDRFATALADVGVSKGDKVALYLLNCPQYVIAYFGALRAGATTTSVSPVYTSQEVKHQLTDSGAKTVVCEDILYDNIAKAGIDLENIILSSVGDYLPFLKKMFRGSTMAKAYQGMETPTPQTIQEKGLVLFRDLIKKYPPQPPVVTFNPAEDIAALPYTGGTTGQPKAAILTHSNLVSLQDQTNVFWPHFEDGKETVIAFLPFFHIYGQVVLMLSSLTHGHTIVLFTTPDMDLILAAVERYQASAFFGVPTLFEYLKEYNKTNRVNWKRIKMVVCGADTLHESTMEDWERRTGSKILEGYGMTETTAVSHATPFDRPKAGSFGVPIPGVTAAVVEVGSTKAVPVGEVGELILHGPNMMQGYWQRPEETEKSLIELDGRKWLRTGDLVKMDQDGYFYFIEREKDLIKYKGYSVFARHVEEVLTKHPQIKAAGVIGVPDPKAGHNIKAFIVLQSDARGKISEEEIIQYCTENLAHYKVPKIIEFRGELPKTDVGKVSRQELRAETEEI